VKKGDLVVNKLLAWMGAVGVSEYDGVTSPAYDILRRKTGLSPYYYHYLFRQKIVSQEFKRFSRGIMEMRLRLYFDKLGVIMVPFPPVNEQETIVSQIQLEIERIEATVNKISLEVNLIQEYKTTLIAEAVTGKIDVREWEPK
jgi:type I restriction enzyme S subunit